MKYNILIKHVNSIPSATEENRVDISRIQMLCEKLGRVNVGGGYIYTFGGMYAHTSGLVLESVLKSSGYPVARITDAYGFDIKKSIYIDGISPGIEEFTSILTYIRDILKKNKDISFLREEVVFAFCLYVSKILGAKYVILENTREDTRPMFEICAPFNFAILPKLYGDAGMEEIERISACIDKVNRGVVTGNNQQYNYLSSKCHKAGIRLSIHRSVEIADEKMRQQTFVYNKREYTLKSSSPIFRDAAISALELVEMMKNHGAKIPPSSILDGIKSLGNCGCIEVVSLSPMIISDISTEQGQIALSVIKMREHCAKSNFSRATVILDCDNSSDIVKNVFPSESNVQLLDVTGLSHKEIVDRIMRDYNNEKLTLIFGGIEFTENIKNAIKSKMDRF